MNDFKFFTKFSDAKARETTCIFCNKKFRTKSPLKQLCSKECSAGQRRKKEAEELSSRPWFIASCFVCGKTFNSREPKKNCSRRRTCSAECHRKLCFGGNHAIKT